LVYLQVAERLVTAVQDPLIREQALGPALPDTAARSQVTWQVRALTGLGKPEDFENWVADRTAVAGHLAARVEKPDGTDDDPCVLPPDAAFRAVENQLYRVEIHAGGTAGEASFKRSRDNGSVVCPITALDGRWVTLGRDDKLAIEVGDWVEVVDDADTVAPLLRVEELDPAGRRVLSDAPDVGRIAVRHPLPRRWDQQLVPVAEGKWLDLEDGVQAWFGANGTYRTGDHWLVPARTLSAEVEWPQDSAGRSSRCRRSELSFRNKPVPAPGA